MNTVSCYLVLKETPASIETTARGEDPETVTIVKDYLENCQYKLNVDVSLTDAFGPWAKTK